jgi:GAF domain-containing protein
MRETYLGTIVRLACEIADAHGGSLFLVDGGVLRPYILYNLPEEYVLGIGPVRIGTQCCGRAVEAKRPWIVTDMLEDPLFADGREGAANSLIRAAFSVPVLEDDRAIGSLACHFTSAHTPTRLDIERNEHFARLIAITMKGGQADPHKPYFAWPTDRTARPAASLERD